MTKICPCKDCVAPKRHQGCHAECGEYRDWNAERQEDLERVRKIKYYETVCVPDVFKMHLCRRRRRR